MRKLLALLLLPSLASAQGLNQFAPGQAGGKVLASFPLTTSGPLINEDALTVAHVYWNGTTLVDTKGNAWTQNGTVPQVTANPFTTTRYGAGPFSTSNYYSLGTGSDALDFAGDFTACVVYNKTTAANESLVLNGGFGGGGSGYMLGSPSAGTAMLDTYDAGSTNTRATTANAGTPPTGLNIACAGRSGTTQYVKLNLGTTASQVGAKVVAGTGVSAKIGAEHSAASYSAFSGTIYEFWATATPWDEATVTAIQQKVLGHFDGSSPLSVTRANSTATYLNGSCAGTDQCLWTAPANVARITTDGLLVEPQRVNYALQSNTIGAGPNTYTSPWANASAGTVSVIPGSTLTGSWAEITSTANNGVAYAPVTIASSTNLVASVWMAKASGTGAAHVAGRCDAVPTTCTCVRSDGGSCTATKGGNSANDCGAHVTDLGTTPVRVSAIAVCPNPLTATYITLAPGAYGSATGTTRFTGAQLEVGTYPTSLIVTTGTSATRNADAVSATVPAVPSKWCVAVTGKPEDKATFGDGSSEYLLHLAPAAQTNNTARLQVVSATSLGLFIRDNAGADLSATATVTNSGHRFVACNSPGSVTISIDGVGPGTLAGAGTGVMTTVPTTIFLGERSNGSGSFGGYLKNLKLCAASNAKGCK